MFLCGLNSISNKNQEQQSYDYGSLDSPSDGRWAAKTAAARKKNDVFFWKRQYKLSSSFIFRRCSMKMHFGEEKIRGNKVILIFLFFFFFARTRFCAKKIRVFPNFAHLGSGPAVCCIICRLSRKFYICARARKLLGLMRNNMCARAQVASSAQVIFNGSFVCVCNFRRFSIY